MARLLELLELLVPVVGSSEGGCPWRSQTWWDEWSMMLEPER